MGALSRDRGFWQNSVMFKAYQAGTDGQMSVYMQEELEKQTDAIDHLRWVTQRAAEAQLDAQYRLARIQEHTNGELRNLNNTASAQTTILSTVSTQLDGVTALLQSMNDTQLEHATAVKAERLLKEVLFQLAEMLSNMIVPADPVAQLFLSRTALEVLDKHRLSTQHLSDLDDKRAFADFVKAARQQVRDADREVQTDLMTFEMGYKTFEEERRGSFPPHTLGQSPQDWASQAEPQFTPRTPPQLMLKVLRDRPSISECIIPIPLPDRSAFQPLPATCFDGSPYEYYTSIEADSTTEPLVIKWGEIPLEADTASRFPAPQDSSIEFVNAWGKLIFFSLLFGIATYMLCSLFLGTILALALGCAVGFGTGRYWKVRCDKELTKKISIECVNARAFEGALRRWAKQAQEWYDNDPAWNKERADVEAENVRIRNQVFPEQLREFEQSEDERRSEYGRSCNEHRTAELARYDQWRASVRDYLATESQRRNQWLSRLESYLACLREKAMRLNMFLEDHPDCQILYSVVDGERVAEEHRKKAMASLKAIDQSLEEWRRRSEQEMPSHPGADQRSVAEPSEDGSQESL